MQDRHSLQTLVASSLATHSGETSAVRDADLNMELQELEYDLQEPEGAIADNLPTFERKLELVAKDVVHNTERIVTRESDRVIETVISGPHDKIRDKV